MDCLTLKEFKQFVKTKMKSITDLKIPNPNNINKKIYSPNNIDLTQIIFSKYY